MTGGENGTVSNVVTDSYEVLYGSWPENYDEVILVLDKNNSISAGTLYQLGFITADQYEAAVEKIENGEEADEINLDYAEVCGHTFYLVSACDYYVENEDGTFTRIEDDTLNEEQLLENAVELKITGVVRPNEDAENAGISTAVGYTSKLTDYIIAHTDESAVIKAQEATPEMNVLNGMEFEAADDTEKIADAKEYIGALGISDKAALYRTIMYYSSQNTEESGSAQENRSRGNGNWQYEYG